MSRLRDVVRDVALTAAVAVALPVLSAAAGAAYGLAASAIVVWTRWVERGREREPVDGSRDG